MSFESIYRNAGIDPRQRMEVLVERVELMKARAHSRAVPPKDLNGGARQHRCSDSVEIRVDAAHARTRSKIEDSKSTIITARAAPFN